MSDKRGLDLVKDILIEGIEWRSKAIARDVKHIQYDKISSRELNELTEVFDKALLEIHRLYGR